MFYIKRLPGAPSHTAPAMLTIALTLTAAAVIFLHALRECLHDAFAYADDALGPPLHNPPRSPPQNARPRRAAVATHNAATQTSPRQPNPPRAVAPAKSADAVAFERLVREALCSFLTTGAALCLHPPQAVCQWS